MMNKVKMNTEKLSGIVVYTIHDKDELRDALRNALVEQMNAEYLDEFTYGVPINSKHKTAASELKEMCKKVEAETKVKFGTNDFVKLYYPTFVEESGGERYIIQKTII